MKKSNTDEFVKKARKIHGDIYDYSKVIYEGQNIKIIIDCLIHGPFLQTPHNHLSGHKCPSCSYEKNKSNTEEFIKRSEKIHNNFYNYSKVNYINNNTKIIIICPKHGEFLQIPNTHLNSGGCYKCGKEKMGMKLSKTAQNFIEDGKRIHNGYYNYDSINYKDYHTKVKIICHKHGEFLQTPHGHLQGSGCSKCGKIIQISKLKLTKDEFIKKAEHIHGKEKYNYDISDYKNFYTKIKIICLKHGTFFQTPDSHLKGNGCPTCRSSKGETKIYNFLKENNIPFIQQKWFKNCRNDITNRVLRFDFYIPSKNLLIEYDGKQHFVTGGHIGSFICNKIHLKNIQFKDNIKNEFVKNNNIDLLRINYKQINHINEVLKEKFNL